jgi:hypothetical protein
MRNIKTITVLPLEWKDNGRYSYLANDLTRALISGVKKAKTYNLVEPLILKDIEKSGYWEYVDVYIDCEIISITTQDETDRIEEKDDDDNKTKKYVTRTTTVNIEYEYISAIDEKVLGTFNKTSRASERFVVSSGASKSFGELLLNMLFSQGPSPRRLSKTAVLKFSFMMNNELNPYTTKEERQIAESKNKDQVFKNAKKLVKQKNYFEALMLYKNIYKETGSVVAGYNMALLLQANNQFIDALALLEELDKKISKTNTKSPPFLIKETERLKVIINELEILDEYKN